MTPKAGHTFSEWFTTTQPTCMEEGIQTRECTYCGVTERRGLSTSNHDWDAGRVVMKPTTEHEGATEWLCNVCGMSRTRPIPKIAPGTSAAPDASPAESSGALAADAADTDRKSVKHGGRGGKLDAGENSLQSGAEDAAPKHDSSVGRILLFTLVPVLPISAVVIFLLIRRKKIKQQ